MVRYEIKKEIIHNDVLGRYVSYGLYARDDSGNKVMMCDIFQNKEEAEKYISLFNDEQLEIVHLEQVIEDYLRYGSIV